MSGSANRSGRFIVVSSGDRLLEHHAGHGIGSKHERRTAVFLGDLHRGVAAGQRDTLDPSEALGLERHGHLGRFVLGAAGRPVDGVEDMRLADAGEHEPVALGGLYIAGERGPADDQPSKRGPEGALRGKRRLGRGDQDRLPATEAVANSYRTGRMDIKIPGPGDLQTPVTTTNTIPQIPQKSPMPISTPDAIENLVKSGYQKQTGTQMTSGQMGPLTQYGPTDTIKIGNGFPWWLLLVAAGVGYYYYKKRS